MRNIIDFQINQKTIFRVVGNDDFTSFSEVEIIYNMNNEIILFKDFLIEGIKVLRTTLYKAIESRLQTFDLGERKSMGFLWNDYCSKLNTGNQGVDDLVTPFHLWSTNSTLGFDTWIYNISDKIFIEISPTYKWHFDELPGSNYITYDQFISKYAPIDIFEIDKSTAKDWFKICEDTLSHL